jgi:TIR domain
VPGQQSLLELRTADREPVRRISEHLRRAGLHVWDPEQGILPGADWMSMLTKTLNSAAAMVVFSSPDAMEPAPVNREIEYALGAKHLRAA